MIMPTDLIEKIPLLVAGKLPEEEQLQLDAAIKESPELQTEVEFWQGVMSISAEMPFHDFSNHLAPEMLDKFARNQLNQFSPEYSHLSGHIHSCNSCREDVELLKKSFSFLPEDRTQLVTKKKRGLVSFLAGMFLPKKAVSVALSVLILLVVAVSMFPWGSDATTTTIPLTAQFEKRSFAEDQPLKEYQVSLDPKIDQLIFSFVTDRLDIEKYKYGIVLQSADGESLSLNQLPVTCKQTKLTNVCELAVTDIAVLTLLKQGGSFSIIITEQFPDHIDFLPSEYEYYFHVTVE